jgi:hypothetical protein
MASPSKRLAKEFAPANSFASTGAKGRVTDVLRKLSVLIKTRHRDQAWEGTACYAARKRDGTISITNFVRRFK